MPGETRPRAIRPELAADGNSDEPTVCRRHIDLNRRGSLARILCGDSFGRLRPGKACVRQSYQTGVPAVRDADARSRRVCLESTEPVQYGFSTGTEPVREGCSMVRVLVVDDEPDYPELLSIILGAEGFDVQTATTGAEAMRVVEHFVPDVLIVDWMLEASDSGLDVAKAIESRNPNLRTILITGYPSPSLEARIDQLPNVELLAKPFTPADLVAMVRAAADPA